MSFKNFIATRMLQLAQQQKDEEDQEKNGTSSVTAVQPNDPYVRWSTYVRDNMGVDNAATAKLRDFMSPANQVQRANDFFSGVRSASNPYTHPDNAGLQNPYGQGTVLYDLYEAAKSGKDLSFGTKSAIEQIGNMNAYEKMGINDPYLAIAARNDVANQLSEALNRGMAARDETKPHDLVSTYVDENAGKGYSVTSQAGDLHDFRGDVLKNAEIKKKNVQKGLYNNDELLQAGEYDLLSPDYMDMIIKDYPAKIAELGPMIDAAKSERTPYEQHWNKSWFRDLHECQTLGLPLEPEDMYQFAATMYPGETYVRADFEEYGDPEAIARVSQDVASMVAMHGNGGWEEARNNKVKQLEAQRDSLQMVLDDTKAAQGRQKEIFNFEKKYAGGDAQFHPESFLEHGAAFDISDRLLYINLMGNPDGSWQKDAATQMGREHLGTNNYDLEALGYFIPEEVDKINAAWNANHDAEEIEHIIDLYAPILYARQREELENREAYAADRYTLGYDIYNNTINALGTSAEGLRNFFVSIADSLGFDVKGIDDPNSPYYNSINKMNFGHQWRATQAETSLPGFGEKLYGIPTGALREGTKLGVSSLLGGAMGGLGFADDAAKAAARAYEAASGVEALGSGLKEGYERGYGKFAPLYAGGSAAMAGATEHIGVDNLFKGSGKWWKTMVATGAPETIEELTNMAGEGMLERGFDAASGRKFSDNDRLFLQTYMDTGSVEEAEAAVAKANLEEAATTAVTSFGIGALLGAPVAYQESSAMRKRGKSVSSNSNTGALMDVAMSLDEGSEARQLAETMKAQADKGKKPSNGQLGRLYAATAKDLDEQSVAVLTETMQDAIVDEMVDKGETEEVARRAAPILAKQLRGEKLTKADTQALVESKTATTMMEELNKHTEGGKEDGPKTGLFKRTNKGTKAAEQQQDEAGSKPKPLQRPAWVDDVEIRQAVYAAPKSGEIASKGKALADTTRPSTQTAISKSGDKAKALTVKEGAAKEGVRDTTAVPLGSKESVDIQRIEADKDGVLKVVTTDSTGKESKTSYQTLSFKGGSVGHVVTHAVDNYAGNAEMANLMYQGYTGGDSKQYIAEMDAAYRAGFDAVAVDRDSMGKYKGVAQHAFELGQKQAQEAEQTRLSNIGKAKLGKGRVAIPASVDESKLSKQQRNQVSIVRRIADATGVNFTFYESQADATGMYEAENGSYDSSTNSIRLDLNAGKNFKGDIAEHAIVRTAAHEMTHFIEANSRENYAKMRQFIADELARKGLNFNSLVQAKIDRSPVPLTHGGAIAEVVADGCEMMLKDSEAIQRLMQKDASLGEQIKKVLKEFIGRIRKAFENIRPGSIEANALMDEVDGVLKYADELQKLWDAGLEEAVEATRGDGLSENGVIVESKTAYANPQLSVRTWYASGYVQERDTMAKELAAKTGVTVSKATKWLDDVNSIASMVLSDPLRLDYISSEFGSAFKSNPEYGGSVDMSTLCPKRRLATGTLDAIQDRLGDVALTRDDFLRLRAMMAERGHEVACGLCFVESSRANLSKYNKQFIDLYNATHPDQDPVTMGELNTIDGLENIRSERPDVYAEYEKFMNKLAQRKPKLFEKRTEYDGEILKKFRKDTTVDAKNRNGGLRLQSFSDFELVHLIDMMQVITDMASVGLAGQAYTKVPDFAWALGDTGLKINLSLIAKGVDENGKLIFNDIEGMNHVEAKKLRDAYSKNVGTILVTFTDEQLIAAMQDDFVDFIIPFHRSQWKKTDYRILGLPEGTKDYTLHQNEKLGRKRVKENFMPNEYWDFTISGKENAQKYLGMCNAEGRTPKFAKFLQKNADGTYSLKDDGSTDGYWKLLIDFKMYDNDGNGSEQLPVQPNFNMEQAARMLNEYKGGHETLPVAWDVVDDFVAEYQGKKGVQSQANIKKDTTLENALQEKARQQGASTLQRASGVYDASVPQELAAVNKEQQFSLRTPAPATTRDYLLSLTDADLSTDGEKDAMKRYRVMVDELRELEEKRAAQQEIAATATGDERIKAKNRADIYTVQIDRLNARIRGKENTNVLRPVVAEAKAILEANRQLEIGRPVETVIKGMGGKVRDAEAKLNRFREKVKLERDAREKITSSRRRITKMVKYLDTLRRKESDYKHVPEELKPTVNALVAAFAEHSSMVFDSKRAERIAQAYSKLQALDNDLAAYYDPDIQEKIEYIAALMEMKRGKPMKLAEMEIIEDVVGSIYKMVRGSNEAFFEGQSMDIAQIAADVADEMLRRKDRSYWVNSKTEEGLDTLIRNGNLTPVYYFDNLNNSMLKRLGYDILGGQDKYGLYQRDDRVTMGEIRKKYNYNSWRNDKPIVHNDVQFTKEQALWVYATAKREATNELAQTHHLDEGGIVFEGGEVVGADGKKRKRTTPMRLSAKDVQAITSTLTEEQKGYADAVVQHLSTTVGDRGNEVSMRMYGFRKYREQYYFPYKTASDQRHQTSVSNAVSATNDARLKHQSFSNPLKKGANTPLVIGDFTEMATSHMNAMNTYAAMVIPVENMNRVLNRKTEIDGAATTLRGLMAQKYGDSTKRYLETLLKDLNGGAQVDNRTGGLIDKTVGMYKKGAVVGSASVVLQQWTSIFRAAYMINPKYLAGATFQKRDWDELVKYSGVATIKDMGRFDVNVGVGGSNWLAADADDFNTWEKAKQMLNPRDWETFKTRWDDAVNFLPGWADRVTWAQIWNAVKAEQADQHPGMDKTSDAFLKMCAERFNDIINHTQVYDSTMTRSQLMRSKGALDKMATAFGSEPTAILNMVYDAIHNPAYKGKRKGKIGAGIATVTLSQLAAAAMQALASAWRKDDDERKALEKFLDKWSYNFIDNMNPFTMFPYLRDMWDTFTTSYDVERSDMALFSELKDALAKLDNDSYSPYRKVEEIAGTAAKFLGIPLKNIMRDLRSAYNAILKTDWSVPEASNIGYTLLDNLPFRDSSKTAYYQRMENAYASGDEERADDIAQYLENNGTTEDAVGDKLSGMLKNMLAAGNDKAVDAILADMAARGIERDGSDLRKTINGLYKDGKITWQQAERLYKRHTNLTSANDLYWHKAEMDYKGEGNYTPYLAAREALMAGDKKTFLAEKSKLLSHGKEPKGITSAIGDLKDELLALYETDPVAARQLRDMIVWAYMECGKTKQSANRLIDGWFK